jgi:hypothetical protein
MRDWGACSPLCAPPPERRRSTSSVCRTGAERIARSRSLGDRQLRIRLSARAAAREPRAGPICATPPWGSTWQPRSRSSLPTSRSITALRDYLVCGELALGGELRVVPGVLAMAITARSAGFASIIVPESNRAEAALVDGIDAYAVPALADAVPVVLGHGAPFRCRGSTVLDWADHAAVGDFADVRGQVLANARSRSRRPADATSCSSDHPAADHAGAPRAVDSAEHDDDRSARRQTGGCAPKWA